jgi:pimeloyl-ACP methyl ester carboxylesterase
VTQVVSVSDKRKISVDSWGAPNGIPVFLLHGTPGSRNGPLPRPSVLYRLGVRLISYDRPGYGKSDPQPGRTVADAAADVRDVADFLELDKFGVVGRSGGGPHALACAALLPERVQSAACLVGLAPADAKDLEWFAGMTESNQTEFATADDSREAITAALSEQAGKFRAEPDYLLRLLLPKLTGADQRVVSDVAIRRLLTDTYAEAVKTSAQGWVDDDIALRSPWGFSPADIKAPVLLWHGAEDVFSPVEHTRWLAKEIPHSVADIQSGASHFTAVEILPDALAWVRNGGPSEGLGVKGSHERVLQA